MWVEDFWLNLENLFMFYLAGVYSNWFVLSLSIAGTVLLFIKDDCISRILSVWTIILSLLLPFVHLEPFNRIFLLLPLHVIYPLGLIYVINDTTNIECGRCFLIFLLALFLEANYVFRNIIGLVGLT
ncbi:hypothetical protein DRN86_05805 [Candidatus Geothermarchaeota archaeon]|mgnify:CR=1 FL=1|nr:MAG: hypothetical protein DRN86_05805 [Candidatus Geothermarchaeota archaeon]